MKPGQARLLTGIGCVGTLVVFAVALLITEAPDALLPAASDSPIREYVAILCFVAFTVILLLPFDFTGGILIPAALEPTSTAPRVWLKKWLRSVAIQVLFFSISLFCYLQIGRAIGAPWLVALFAGLQVALLAGQELIWRTMTSVAAAGRGSMTDFVPHSDQRFAGGITGLPGFERILVPVGWRTSLQPSWLNLLIKRRQAALHSGGRFRGVVAAMLWNISSFTGAIIASGAVMVSVADLVTVFLWFLLFSFVGLLVLPMWNRRAVFALDRYLASRISVPEFQDAIREVDQLTERDPIRSVSAESVFQPIPCPERRSSAMSHSGSSRVPAWNIARTALFLSWAFGGPLARAVHCNVGRPELWALLPSD